MMHRARRRFGQNFLHDRVVIDAIVRAIDPQPDDSLLEIGPGLGALTWSLLTRIDSLTVVEIDRDLIARLAARGHPGLQIIEQDVLTLDLHGLAADRPFRVLGNLPYNISTPLLIHLLEHRRHIVDIHVMLQKEVVDRLGAECGTRDYGRLSVLLQSFFAVYPLFEVGADAFDPAPKVRSAVVRLVPHAEPVAVSVERLSQATRIAFASRRKTLRNNLRGHLDADVLERAGVDPAARAETLSLQQFATLADLLPPTCFATSS